MSMLPAVVYAAKSTADEHGSIPTQVADCQDAIAREGGRKVLGPYTDDAASAFKGNRGQGLADAKKAATDAAAAAGWRAGDPPAAELWVQHSDRLARGDGLLADHLLEVWFDMRRAGVRLRSVQDDANLAQVITVAVSGEQNTGYSQRLRAAVTSGKDRQMERGHRLGGPVPDGLRLVVHRDENDRVISREYVRDDERAPIIEEAFALAEAGHGDSAIAAALNRRGYRTRERVIQSDSPKTGAKAGDVIPPQPWSRRRVQDTLTNQTYAGRVVRHRGKPNEVVAPATNVEALLSPERFDALQEQRAQRDRSLAGRERARERGKLGGAPTLRYALSRLATCARCGAKMRCDTSPYKRKDGSQARRYTCANVKDQTGLCDAPPVDAEAVDAAIVPQIKHFFDDFASWSKTVAETADVERQQLEAQLAELRGRRETLTAAQPRAQERYAKYLAAGDDARADAALDALAQIKSDAAEIDRQIAEAQATLGSLATDAEPSDSLLRYWHELAESIKGRLTNATGLADVNAELRVVLDRVQIDTRDDRKIELRAIYKRKGTWEPATRPVLDVAGQIPEDPDYEIDPDGEPTFVPDDVLILARSKPRPGRRAALERPSPSDVSSPRGSGNYSHE